MQMPAMNRLTTHSLRAALTATTALLIGTLVAAAGPPKKPSAASARSIMRAPTSSRATFARRILPIFRSKNPSTCSECHLSGVDLKDYIRPSEAETFVALRERGMIDMKNPQNSHILRFIQMSRPKSPLVTQKARGTEYAAFRDWIVAAVNNPKLASASAPSVKQPIGPALPDPVIRHTRVDSVVASFERNIWSQEGRCMGCHRPDNEENVRKYGERVRWFVPDSPEETMRRLIAQGDVSVDAPDQSLLLLKPLNRVPHGGGVKMLYGDTSYKMFRTWLEDYAASVKGKYHNAKDLPTPPTQALVNMNSVLTINDGPNSWANKLLRADVYAWDSDRNAWARQPMATGERLVYAGNNGHTNSTNLIMFLIVPLGKEQEAVQRIAKLQPGRYLLKYYCDTAGKLSRDYTISTDAPDFYQGQQEIKATWNGGWGSPVVVRVGIASAGTLPK